MINRLVKRSGLTWGECSYEALEWTWDWKNIQWKNDMTRSELFEKKMNELFKLVEKFGKITSITSSWPGTDYIEVAPPDFCRYIEANGQPESVWVYFEPFGEDVGTTIQPVQIQPAAGINLDNSAMPGKEYPVSFFLNTEFFMSHTKGNRIDNRKVFHRNADRLEYFLKKLEDIFELRLAHFNKLENFISPYCLEVKPERLPIH